MVIIRAFLYNVSIKRKRKCLTVYTEKELSELPKEEIIKLILSIQEKRSEMERQFAFLTEQVDILKNYQFGRKSEKGFTEDDGQLTLS